MRRMMVFTVGAMLAAAGCREELTSPSGPSAPPRSTAGPTAALADSVLLMAVGDMHSDCGNRSKRAKATAAIIGRYPSALVVPMGDDAGHFGTAAEFQCFEQDWGALKGRSYPAIGNHERDPHGDPTAKPYYDYYNGIGVDSGRAGRRGRGYYTLDYGGWRILVGNSNQLRPVQTPWFTQQLAVNPRKCTMAIWHRPLFTSAAEPPDVQVDPGLRPWWKALYAAKADVVLNGHAHQYERFARMGPDGKVDTARGIREFVVGTGGASLFGFLPMPHVGSQKRLKTWGVLKLTLWPTRYKWEFIDTTGRALDWGQDTCR
jgi:hypothetical protein